MMPFVIVFVVQVLIAGVIIFVLKHLLDRELEKAAVEKLMSLKTNEGIKTINIYYFKPLLVGNEQEVRMLVKNKFSNSEIIFEQLNSIKGGLIIKVGEEVLDFSLSSRLENFWS